MVHELPLDNPRSGKTIQAVLRPVCTVPVDEATLEALRAALAQGNLVVCVGPRVARSIGLPSRESLATELLGLAIERDPEGVDARAIQAALAAGRGAEALGELRHALGTTFDAVVERGLSDQGHPVPPVAVALASLGERLRAIYTTTLDRLVERAFEGRWPSFATPRAELSQRRRVIVKLHGTLELRGSWVLTHEQARRELGPNTPRRELVEAAYRSHHLLLVGFEAGDPELRELVELFPVRDDATAASHTIVLEHPPTPTERRRLLGVGLEIVEGELLSVLVGLGGHAGAAPVAAASEACPYPGLEAFTEEQASSFFGRHMEISQAASRLGGSPEHRRWLSIEGPSGVGKSSFVHAGVIPALRNGFAPDTPPRWLVARMRPGPHPMRALVETVVRTLGLDHGREAVDHHTAWWSHDPSRSVALLRQHVPAGHAFALVVDQLEEAVTLADQAERAPFGELLVRAIAEGVIYLVTTIRSDFVPALQADLPSLAGLLNEGAERYSLPPMSRVGLREAIAEPAARLGVRVEADLVERIIADVDAGGRARGARGEVRASDSALPLVAHMLRGLWDAGAASDRVLELREYVELGALMGALGRSADGALVGLSPVELAHAQRLLLGLVRIGDDGQATRRTLPTAEALELAGGPAHGEALLARLSGSVDAHGRARTRLLVTHVSEGSPRIDLVHEALLRDWGTLHTWIEQNRYQLVRDEELDRRARRWQEAGSPIDDLPMGRELAELQEGRPHGERAELHRRYHEALRSASARWRRRARRGRIALIAGLGVAALASSVATFVLFRQNDGLSDELAEKNAALEQANGSLAQRNGQLEDSNAVLEQSRRSEREKKEDLERKTEELEGKQATLAMVVDANAGLADLVVSAGEVERVRGHLEGQLLRFEELQRADPSELSWMVNRRNALQLLGDLEARARQWDRADQRYEECLGLTRELTRLEADDALAADYEGDIQHRLGQVAQRLGTLDEAREHHQQALAIRQARAEAEPSDPARRFDVAASHLELHGLGGPDARTHLSQAKAGLDQLEREREIAGHPEREAALQRVSPRPTSELEPKAPSRGPLTTKEISRVLGKKAKAVKQCGVMYDATPGEEIFVAGKIDLGTGRVTEASALSARIGASLGRCIAGAVEEITFRRGTGEGTRSFGHTFEL
ncbi:MAG: SIR2 family protein [Myxococcales bacterium]|nr:SIR2 family protein [Myxococcales bacterium]